MGFKPIVTKMFLVALITAISSKPTLGWSDHPLMAYPVLSSIPGLSDKPDIKAVSLEAFLLANEAAIEKVLGDYEQWAATNLPYYPPLPPQLRFVATGDSSDIVKRFLRAIRINPDVTMKLYLQLLPNQDVGDRVLVDPHELTPLKNIGGMVNTNYVKLTHGQLVSPIDVLSTANDEPDYGFDIGLFENNNTTHGKEFGFGNQPFGDPNLEYGSQAPFHMGFFHEARIVFALAPFLKRTLVEYRITLFSALSKYAFNSGNDYWGWRFMGWGMHYIGDLSMPYHSKPLPGVSPLRMIWMNIKAMLGFTRSRDNAVQLVSNRHAVLEELQRQLLRKAYSSGDVDNILFQALRNPIHMVEYNHNFPRFVVAKEAAGRANHLNEVILKWMPKDMVANPKNRVTQSPDFRRIVELTKSEKGSEALPQMTKILAEMFSSYSMHIRSFYNYIAMAKTQIASKK